MRTFAIATFAALAAASKYDSYKKRDYDQYYYPAYDQAHYLETAGQAYQVDVPRENATPKLTTSDPDEWARPYYAEFDEQEREDWDTDMWGQQMLNMELNDIQDEAELARSLNQDAVRSELDKAWELYMKNDYDMKYDYQYGYEYKSRGDYVDDVDVRAIMKQLNDIWDADVQAVRSRQRADLEAEREAHREEVRQIVAAAEAEIARLKQEIIDARMAKRDDVEALNAALRAQVSQLLQDGIQTVNDLNDAHNDLVLEITWAQEQGWECDIKTILENAGYGDLDLYADAYAQEVERVVQQPVAIPTMYPSYPSYPQYNQYQSWRHY